jgi:protocatechuate 3,4-dioxygenase beta subunit
MKRLLWFGALALAATAIIGNARAADYGGVTGYVRDLNSGEPLEGVSVEISSSDMTHVVRTDKNGFFADITLQPGFYSFYVTGECAGPERVNGQTLIRRCGSNECSVATVLDGERSRVTLYAVRRGWSDAECYRPVHPSIVDPNQSADLYRM